MTGDLAVGPLRRRHLRGVLGIEEQVYPKPWSRALFTSELAQVSSRSYLVALDGGQVVGYAGAMYVLPDAHVTTVAVDPARQGRGIGARLLLEVGRATVAAGATALTLEVRVSNEPAQRLYRRFGFVPAGARKGYYARQGAEAEDALVMWVHDVDQPDFAARLDAVEAALLPPDRSPVYPLRPGHPPHHRTVSDFETVPPT